jgi:sporulation protein YlmC with PRC-barrel domain
MKLNIRTTLLAGAIAALIAGPTWAESDTSKDGAYTSTPNKAESGQSERGQPTGAQPMSETPGTHGAAYVGTTERTSAGDNPLYTRSAEDLDGVEVVDRAGEKVGNIKQIVLAPNRKSAHAVIATGGLLGMGASDIMMSLDDLTPIGDKLQMSATKAEATAQTDAAPDADQYVEVTGDTPISGSIVEFSAFEQSKDANKPGATSTTPKVGTDTPATAPETPTAPQ